jgi:hypothetical protein
MEASDTGGDDLRKQAVQSLERKRAFRTQVLTWIGVSVLLVVIWAVTGGKFFWPIFPIAGWGIGIVAQGWSIYGPGAKPISEAEIERESERLQR